MRGAVMSGGKPSVTAQRVAAYRRTFDRLPAGSGDPSADDRLAEDVAGTVDVDPDGPMGRYLRARTAFFDRVVVNALDRGVRQVVTIGAGYDGRALRYARADVRWYEVDHPDTQQDKRARLHRLGLAGADLAFVGVDLMDGGVAPALVAAGFEPDGSSLLLCEGVAVYLDDAVLGALLRDLRAVSTVGTRLAISFSTTPDSTERQERRRRFEESVEALGEPARSALSGAEADGMLTATRWVAVPLSERAGRAGFVVARPLWAPDRSGSTRIAGSRAAAYMEQLYHREGTTALLSGHLEERYGIVVDGVKEIDVGVYRIRRRDGTDWVARVFPATRPLAAVEGDASILQALAGDGFPAERCAHAEPVSSHQGQGVLVTDFVDGTKPGGTVRLHRTLGELLGRLHTRSGDWAATARPGGAWHHLMVEGGPPAEIAAALALFDAAAPRVAPHQGARYRTLRDRLAASEDGHDLPEAMLHPDFVPANTVVSNAGPVLVDWAGAGRGPRLMSLGFLLWAAGDPKLVDAVVAGYRRSVRPDADELARLPGAVLARPLLFDCWSWVTGRSPLADVVSGLDGRRRRAEAIAERAVEAFAGRP